VVLNIWLLKLLNQNVKASKNRIEEEEELSKKMEGQKITRISIYSFLQREKQKIITSCYAKAGESTYAYSIFRVTRKMIDKS